MLHGMMRQPQGPSKQEIMTNDVMKFELRETNKIPICESVFFFSAILYGLNKLIFVLHKPSNYISLQQVSSSRFELQLQVLVLK